MSIKQWSIMHSLLTGKAGGHSLIVCSVIKRIDPLDNLGSPWYLGP